MKCFDQMGPKPRLTGVSSHGVWVEYFAMTAYPLSFI